MRTHSNFTAIGIASAVAVAMINVGATAFPPPACDTWTQRSPAAHPEPGMSRMMAYDSNRGVTVAVRGVNGAPSNETWEYDGTNWTHKTPANAFLPLHSSDMVYDSARHVCVVFGGSRLRPRHRPI